MSVTRITLPPRCAGGVCKITPSGTGSCVPLFDAGAASDVHRPARTGAPGAAAAVGSRVSEAMYERPAAFTPVTIRRTFPGMSVLLFMIERPRVGRARVQDLVRHDGRGPGRPPSRRGATRR